MTNLVALTATRAKRMRLFMLLPILWALPLLLATVGLPVESAHVVAQGQNGGQSKEKTRRTPALRNAVYEKLAKAQELAEAQDYAGALNGLRKLEKEYSGKKALNSYELANVYNFYAFIYYTKEDYKGAIGAYKKVLAQPDLPEAMEIGTLYSLAQLNFVIEDYRQAARMLEQWFKVAPNPAPSAYMLIAQAYYQLKNYDKALQSVLTGMKEAERRELEAKENWYLLLRVLYYEKNDIPKTTDVLETLVTRWPKKDYWLQLSGMYGELKREADQMIIMETIYQQGLLEKERELVNMAYLFLGSDMPYKAAKVLDQGIKEKKIEATSKNLELLGISWRQAQHVNKAIPELERAAKLSNDGEMWSRLASIYLDNDQYKESVSAADRALKKGDLKRADNTQVVKGMALYNQKKYSAAKRAFQQARKDKRSKRVSDQWIQFLNKEIAREKSLQEEV